MSTRITLVISWLGRGGAERVMTMLASAWAEQGKQVTLLTLYHPHEPAYAIHPSVQVRHLDVLGPSGSFVHAVVQNVRRIRALRRAIRESQPDIVVSFIDAANVITVLATRGLHIPTVICEHIDPELCDIGRIWNRLRRVVYPFSDALVCLTSSTLSRFQVMMKVKGRVIPDLIAAPPPEPDARKNKEQRKSGGLIVGMGRLVPQKGFDLLLNAFAGIASRHPDWKVQILGAGPQRQELEQLADALKLSGSVRFVGEVSDPFRVLRSADLFVFPSRFEGFGLALCEAMACGLPVISFDCPSGPGDIIRNGVDGVLVPAGDIDKLADAMDRLMNNAVLRQQLACRAPDVLVRFSREKTLALWQQLLDDLLLLPGNAGSRASIQRVERQPLGK